MSYTYKYPRPAVTTDCVIFRKTNNSKYELLLIQRKFPPFQGEWALPGGFVNMDEDLLTAAKRELEEETNLKDIQLKQFYTFGGVNRDPRHRTIAVAYYGIADTQKHIAKAADDAATAKWFPLEQIPGMAFDHAKIIDLAIKQINPDNFTRQL